MKIIQPAVYIEYQDWKKIVPRIEEKGRVCYKSEERITKKSADVFVENLIKRGHLSALEHESVSVKFIVDRGVSHEIVRHRLASYSQESTRYCNYGDGGGEITVIAPFFFKGANLTQWNHACKTSETIYLALVDAGVSPQEARSVLPNSLKTELWMTANLREWMHFFELRAAKAAHPQMRQVAIPLLRKMKELLPAVFDTIDYDRDFPKEHYADVAQVWTT